MDEPAVTRKAEEQLSQEGGKGSILGGGSTPVAPGKDNSPAGTGGDVQHTKEDDPDTDVETVVVGDKGASPHADSVVSEGVPPAPGSDVTHEANIGNPSKSKVQKKTINPKT